MARAARDVLLVAIGVLALAGCGGSGVHAIAVGKASKLVLSQSDVGKAFAQFSNGPPTQLDTAGTPRADPNRYGREGGWIARYHRGGSPTTSGPLVVESRVDIFKDGHGATVDVLAYGDMYKALPGEHRKTVPVPKLGDAAIGVTVVQPSSKPLRFYEIAWRDHNASASIVVEGFDGHLRLADAVALARKQERRLSHA